MEAAVQALDIGTVLNEDYNIQEYVNRRAGWLARLPHYARMATGLFTIARRDAAEVFKSDHALSVQEVRRREHAAEVSPLLPLPTIDNTDSIDGFRGYGNREWSSGVVRSDNCVSVNDKVDDIDSALGALGATLPSARGRGMFQTAWRTKLPSRHRTELQSAHLGMQSAQTGRSSLVHPANIQQTIESGPSRRSHHRSSDQSTMSKLSSSSPMVTVVSTPATSPLSASSSSHFSQSDALTSEPELERANLDRPGTSSAKSPPSVHVGRNVSALAGRGMHVPVKQQKQGAKRAASEAPQANDSVIGSPGNKATPPPAHPLSKRLKLNGPRDPSQSPSKAASPPAKPSKIDKPESTKKQQPSGGRTKATQQAQPAIPKAGVARRSLESIIVGTRLPANEAEATQAASLRHERLLAQYNKASTNPEKQKKKTTTRTSQTTPAAPAPDFPPEFFNPANFAPSQEQDSVRCVCGVDADDGADMVSCDECLVWQHTRCMGEGVPRKVAEERYVCQVCSPWTHRRLVAKLRKDGGI
ncbi:hypothetical protein LTR01_000255 [Friedmanniomyces endolithicus]|nr:hypothetical protein LTR01_000255 [Friedmanniomyces endolithicus]KAK0834683.1 hypothetical protein LTR73_000972 [Friedmanniomyces endolithicus]